ncbi:MAG: hypothetical protein H6724_11660 [Sandaracinus sp.]|nr:hypothetical protein [Sandaracinus sp.]MCB9620090.1 hypothetical protein [Sandaracinus sp.]
MRVRIPGALVLVAITIGCRPSVPVVSPADVAPSRFELETYASEEDVLRCVSEARTDYTFTHRMPAGDHACVELLGSSPWITRSYRVDDEPTETSHDLRVCFVGDDRPRLVVEVTRFDVVVGSELTCGHAGRQHVYRSVAPERAFVDHFRERLAPCAAP